MSNKIKRILIIVLAVILLVFIVLLSMQVFKSAGEIVEEVGETVIEEKDESFFINEMLLLSDIATYEINQNGNFLNLYINQDFVNKIQEIKNSSDLITIHTNISEDGLKYCAVALYKNKNLCIDNTSREVYFTDDCSNNTTCTISIPEEIIEGEVIEELIKEEVTEKEVIENDPLVIQSTPVIVGDTTLIEEYIGKDKYIVVNGEEMGPYSELLLDYDDNNYGILCKYNGVWYLNINGEVSKESGLNKDNVTVDSFYVLDTDYVYIYSDNGEFFVNDNGEILGPFEEYPNLFE